MELTTIDGWGSLTLFAATVAIGLLAGIYLAFSIAVMPSLRNGSDATFIETMQAINAKIINGWFLAVFFGSAVLPIAAAILLAINGDRDTLWWSIGGSVLAFVAFATTVTRNIPLNEALDDAGPVDAMRDPSAVRRAFEAPWVQWNHYRALACSLALIALIRAVMLD